MNEKTNVAEIDRMEAEADMRDEMRAALDLHEQLHARFLKIPKRKSLLLSTVEIDGYDVAVGELNRPVRAPRICKVCLDEVDGDNCELDELLLSEIHEERIVCDRCRSAECEGCGERNVAFMISVPIEPDGNENEWVYVCGDNCATMVHSDAVCYGHGRK